jgi:hypothetical protein
MSTERPIVRPFTGLEKFEELAASLHLDVRDVTNTVTRLEPSTTARYANHEVAGLGLALHLGWDADEIAAAAEAARISTDSIGCLLIAEDSFLKERVVLESWAVTDVPPSWVIAERGGGRCPALSNPFGGFDLEVVIVLQEELTERLVFRPHRKGTVLAAAHFAVRSSGNGSGLDPVPLDEDTRRSQGLPPGTVLFVEANGELWDAEDMSTVVTVYVNEALLGSLATSRGPERALVSRQLAIDTWSQIVMLLSREAADHGEWNGSTGAALRGLLALVKAQSAVTPEKLDELIRDRPEVLCAMVSGAMRHAKSLSALLDGPESEDPS